MAWEITGTIDFESALDDFVFEIVTSEDALMPPADSKLGHVDLHWDDVGGMRAWLQARGGSVDDRRLAREVLEAQLASHGFVLATLDLDTFQRTADWNKIMDKARRLLSDGAVQVLRNGYNNIVAQVRGDHGNYQSEIFRQDPNSRAITGSDCECGWGEFQNQPRTRQWKRYQDRPCSHILAAFWQAQSMPLDEDAHPDAGGSGGPQDGSQGPQGAPGGQMPPTMGPEADQGFDPAQRSFDPSMGQGQPAGPGGPQGAPEEPQGPSPADVLPQYPMAEMPQPPPVNPISSPQFMVGPTPTSPVAMPPGGAYSSVQPNPWESWHRTGAAGDGTMYHVSDPNNHESIMEHGLDGSRNPKGGYVWTGDVQGQYLFGSQQTANQAAVRDFTKANVYAVNTDGLNVERDPRMPDAHVVRDPITPDRIQWVGQRSTGDDPEVLPSWIFQSAAGDGTDGIVPPPDPTPAPAEPAPLNNGDLVQLRYPDTGVLQGRSEAHGAGQETDLAPGMVGEYMGRDPSTGMHSVLWSGSQFDKNKEMEPYGALGVHFDSYLIPRPDLRRPGPAIRRRRGR